MSPRASLDTGRLHGAFITSLGDDVIRHSDLESKPLEVDLRPPLPSKLRVYLYTLTDPPGGRPADEYKIQLMVPGQGRDEVGNFDHSGGRFVVVGGYHPTSEVFVLWDAAMYQDFAFSRNVQVKAATIFAAIGGGLSRQKRRTRAGWETVLAVRSADLGAGLRERFAIEVRRMADE